jgi:eukaryotic-like serine/threonine-protein kinase
MKGQVRPGRESAWGRPARAELARAGDGRGTLCELRGKDLEDTKELPPGQAAAVAAAVTVDTDRIPAGMRVGSYVIQETIASGGGGTVYAAQPAGQHPPGPRVAIKVMLRELAASRLALSRFQREAEVVGRINHPNIVRVLDSGGLPDGRPFIVMELVSGENLRNMLLRRGRFAPAEMLEVLAPVCSALAAAHAAGVIHRDLKASNICIGQQAGTRVIKLLDFGIAKLVEPDPEQPGLTVKGTRLGTPYAMPPEQIRGENVDERADIYALGVLLYQMLTGNYPFVGSSPHEIERLHLEAIPPRPSRSAPVSAALEAVVLRCMQKEPDARFGSVTELLTALQGAVSGEPPPVRPASSDERDAAAIYVELRARTDAPTDDGLDGASDAVMEEAERALREAGLELPLLTSNALLATRLLPSDAGPRRLAQRDALELATSLQRRLRQLGASSAALEVNVSFHVDRALVRGPASAPQIAGGPIMHILDWRLDGERDGVRISQAALVGL